MSNCKKPLLAALTIAFSASAVAEEASTGTTPVLQEVVVNSATEAPAALSGAINREELKPLRAATSDTAGVLQGVPGVYMQGGGGVSGLPIVHGMGDDRLRIRIDGMDLISACANHMNPPLSYIDPAQVEQMQVYSGVAPVSGGGDSIGAAILVRSKPPRFANAGGSLLTSGEVGGFVRSNGNASGLNAAALVASESVSLSYSGATAKSDNYHSAFAFKPDYLATHTTAGSHMIDGDEVGSSAFKTENHELGIAYRHERQLIELKLGYQHIPYQGFPSQHMDMVDNQGARFNLSYTRQLDGGKFEARVYNEETRHKMDFAEDKLYWYGGSYNVAGMPMQTKGKNTGVSVGGEFAVSARDLLRLGVEYQRYRLSDWWDPVANSMMMSPSTFWNINDGHRDRYDVFGEWEAAWTSQWTTIAGVRSSTVKMNTGTVAGYNAGYNGNTIGGAGYFNAQDRARTDNNFDLSVLARYTPDATQTYEGGYSRKTRSPSLYERYTWSSNTMAMTMNNWFNDGNGYVGSLDLDPEVAHTVSLSADWHDATASQWGFKISPYFSLVNDYIDAVGRVGWAANQYNYLGLANQSARLYGFDISAFTALGRVERMGEFSAHLVVGYVKGKNRDTEDNLYNIMPLNARISLRQDSGNWTNTVEGVFVSAKDDTAAVRNEMATGGYGLFNLRSSYATKHYRVDVGVDNVINKQYSSPLGGAYIGQGTTMSLNGAGTPFGYTVPGMGRSLYAALALMF